MSKPSFAELVAQGAKPPQEMARARRGAVPAPPSPPLPPPPSSPPPVQEVQEQEEQKGDDFPILNKYVATFKKHARATVGGVHRTFTFATWGSASVCGQIAAKYQEQASKSLAEFEFVLRKPVQRTELLHSLGLHLAGKPRLDQQREQLLSHLARGKASSLEELLCRTALELHLSGDLSDSVQLLPGQDGFRAIFQGSQKLQRSFKGAAEAVKWLQGMRECDIKGALAKSLNELAIAASEEVQVGSALRSLAERPADLKGVAASEPANHVIRDVTDKWLADKDVPQGPRLPVSTVCLYKGCVRRLEGLKKEGVAVLAGRSSNVFDVILSKTVADAVSTPELTERWSSLGYEALGMVVWGSGLAPAQFEKDMLLLAGGKTPLLFLALDPVPGKYSAWEVSISAEATAYHRCLLATKALHRAKGQSFTVVEASKLGVTPVDEAGALVSQAISKYVSEHVGRVEERAKRQGRRPFKFWSVPPDGLCCYHSILASLEHESWFGRFAEG